MMKIKLFYAIFTIGVFLSSCVHIPPRADNFYFVYKLYECNSAPYYILDSANRTLTHTPIGDTAEIVISFDLTEEEIESIYQKAMSIDFFDYPSPFVVPENKMLGYEIPASTAEIFMVNGERSNLVSWTNGVIVKPGYKDAENLKEFGDMIFEIIQSHPEIQQLPEPKAGCA